MVDGEKDIGGVCGNLQTAEMRCLSFELHGVMNTVEDAVSPGYADRDERHNKKFGQNERNNA